MISARFCTPCRAVSRHDNFARDSKKNDEGTDDIGSIHDDGHDDRFTRVKVLSLHWRIFLHAPSSAFLNVFSLRSDAVHDVSYSLDLPFLFCVGVQSLKLWSARPALCNTVHFKNIFVYVSRVAGKRIHATRAAHPNLSYFLERTVVYVCGIQQNIAALSVRHETVRAADQIF